MKHRISGCFTKTYDYAPLILLLYIPENPHLTVLVLCFCQRLSLHKSSSDFAFSIFVLLLIVFNSDFVSVFFYLLNISKQNKATSNKKSQSIQQKKKNAFLQMMFVLNQELSANKSSPWIVWSTRRQRVISSQTKVAAFLWKCGICFVSHHLMSQLTFSCSP